MNKNYITKSPVLLILFNRPEYFNQLINALRDVSVSELFISIDAPRENNMVEDSKKISELLEMIKIKIDWECEVKLKTNDKNLGCGDGPKSAISWFFNNVDRGIILEDDCIPTTSFFLFSDTLLEKYEFDKDIWLISGDNGGPIVPPKYFGNKSYLFSRVPLTWGWATWKSVWDKYDEDLNYWQNDYFKKFFLLKGVSYSTRTILISMFRNADKVINKNFWDYQFYSTMLINNGLGIIPKKNLIKNIGFDENATHTKKITFRSFAESFDIEKIKHRNKISNNKKVDKIITYSVHTKVSKWIVDSPLLFLAPLIQFIIRLYRKITALLSF